MWLGRVVVASAQSLCDPHLGVLRAAARAGRLQQPAGLLVPPARISAAVLRVFTVAGTRLVEIPTALPRDNVQGGDVF